MGQLFVIFHNSSMPGSIGQSKSEKNLFSAQIGIELQLFRIEDIENAIGKKERFGKKNKLLPRLSEKRKTCEFLFQETWIDHVFPARDL
jgi:hypothetical protein